MVTVLNRSGKDDALMCHSCWRDIRAARHPPAYLFTFWSRPPAPSHTAFSLLLPASHAAPFHLPHVVVVTSPPVLGLLCCMDGVILVVMGGAKPAGTDGRHHCTHLTNLDLPRYCAPPLALWYAAYSAIPTVTRDCAPTTTDNDYQPPVDARIQRRRYPNDVPAHLL